jgi:hypothetical protein
MACLCRQPDKAAFIQRRAESGGRFYSRMRGTDERCGLQTKLQTNFATQHGIRCHGSERENSEPEHTLSYYAARAVTRILELENRCTGNRTVGSNPILSASY